jgi:hypothetical protein
MQDTTRMLREALESVAPVGRHAIVIGEALRNGGLLDVPAELPQFRIFVGGPLLQAAQSLLGHEEAKQLLSLLLHKLLPGASTLSGTLPMDAPPPHSKPAAAPMGKAVGGSTLAYGNAKSISESTLPYAGDEPRGRIDVAMIEPDAALAERMIEVLERRNYRVLSPKLENLLALCRQLPIRLVFAGVDHDKVLDAVKALGEDAPDVVYVSDDIKDRPKGVVAILPRAAPDHLIEALDTAVRFSR